MITLLFPKYSTARTTLQCTYNRSSAENGYVELCVNSKLQYKLTYYDR